MTEQLPPPEPGGSPAQPVTRDNAQLYGILGIVLAVICCGPLGILFGWLSMQESKKFGKDQTLGKVAFWLGIALTAVALLATVIAACAGGLGAWNDRY